MAPLLWTYGSDGEPVTWWDSVLFVIVEKKCANIYGKAKHSGRRIYKRKIVHFMVSRRPTETEKSERKGQGPDTVSKVIPP